MLDFKVALTNRVKRAKAEYRHDLERLANVMMDEIVECVKEEKTAEEKASILVKKTREQIGYVEEKFANDETAKNFLTERLREFSLLELVELK